MKWLVLAFVIASATARADAPSGYQCGPGSPKVGTGCTCPAGFADGRGDENVAVCALVRKPSETQVIKAECGKVGAAVVRAYGADLAGKELDTFKVVVGKAAAVRCEGGPWRKEARDCFAKAATEEAARECIELLPPLQRGGLDSDAAKAHPIDVVVDKTELKLKGSLVFAQGTAELSSVSLVLVNAIAKTLKERPALRVEIQAHTDNTDPADQNLRLSQKRADTVRLALIGAGVPAGRLLAKGYGEALPVASNSTAWSRAKNRRVQLVVLPPDPKAKPDRDGDGVPDASDKCPDEPETFNNFEDDDGCPDRPRVAISSTDIKILDTVAFKSQTAVIDKAALPLLDAVFDVLKNNPAIRIRVEGHADDLEVDPVKLGAARARAVREYLIQKGIDQSRLEVFTHGDSRPRAVNTTEAGRAQNRRVAFEVIK